MLRIVLFVVGWLYFISSVFGIFIRLFGSDEMLSAISFNRNMDVGIYMLIVSFFMLAFIKILFELHDIKKKLYQDQVDIYSEEVVEKKRKPLMIEPKLNKD